MLSPAEAALRGRLGAHALHSRHDSREITAKAREAFLRRFLDEVDPDRVLPEAERRRRAKHARKAYFARLALTSARARSNRRQRKNGNAAVDKTAAANEEVPDAGARSSS